MRKGAFLKWIIAFAIIIAVAFAWKVINRKQVDTNTLEAIVPTSAAQVIEAFMNNEQAAGAKYNNKALVFSGTIQTIVLNDSVQTVTIGSTIPSAGIVCEFEKEQHAVVQQLKIGDSIQVKGVCTGFLMDIILVRCVLIQ